MSEKNKKVRTSITIDPDLLTNVRREASATPQSVSSYVEAALRQYMSQTTKGPEGQ